LKKVYFGSGLPPAEHLIEDSWACSPSNLCLEFGTIVGGTTSTKL